MMSACQKFNALSKNSFKEFFGKAKSLVSLTEVIGTRRIHSMLTQRRFYSGMTCAVQIASCVSAQLKVRSFYKLLMVISCVFSYTLSSKCYGESNNSPQKSKNWPTYGWSSKYDEPNVNRVNLAYQTPPNPSNFTWTIVARPGTKENSAQAYIERDLVGLVPWKQINFGKVIEPLSVRGFKYEIYYQFDAGGGEKMWLSGSNLKLSEKR